MQDGDVLANSGHFDVEIDLDALENLAEATPAPKEGVTQYHLPDCRRINLLAEGRLVNLTDPFSQVTPPK